MDSTLARALLDATRSVPMARPRKVHGVLCSTYAMVELIRDLHRAGSKEVLQDLRKALRATRDASLTSVVTQYMGEGQDPSTVVDPDTLDSATYQRAFRTARRLDATRSAATAIRRGTALDRHEHAMLPRGPHRALLNAVYVDPVIDSARHSAGAVARPLPHQAQYPSVTKGRLIDSARNAGVLGSASVSPSRRGGRRRRLAVLLARLDRAHQATSVALRTLRARLG